MNINSRTLAMVALPSLLVLWGCSDETPLSPSLNETRVEATGAPSSLSIAGNSSVKSMGPNEKSCWGQATKVFAQTGDMGEHASQQPTPRAGLRNLARLLFEAGIIPEDTMQALGQFVANELGLSIDACM